MTLFTFTLWHTCLSPAFEKEKEGGCFAEVQAEGPAPAIELALRWFIAQGGAVEVRDEKGIACFAVSHKG